MTEFLPQVFKQKLLNEMDFFKTTFPELKEVLDQLSTKSSCGTCVRSAIMPFIDNPDVVKKLTSIIGEYTIKMTPTWGAVAMVREFTEEEYKKFFLDTFGGQKPNLQTRIFSTYYNPETKKVVVSYQWMDRQ